MTPAELKARRDAALGAGTALFYSSPLHIVRGEGVMLYDADGRAYVDMYNNVPCVGHAHPRVQEAVSRQLGRLNVHSRYLHEDIVRLAERLTGLHPSGMEAVIFSCSGSEANEIALRMARMATGRRGIVCAHGTYHGNTELVGSLTGRTPLEVSAEGVCAFAWPDPYAPSSAGLSLEEQAQASLLSLEASLEALDASGHGLAALILCPIFANEGLPLIPEGYLADLAGRVRARGGLLIADEVQSGYGRTGRWWGYEGAGFTPDIVVTGKPMGAGVPLAATAASRALIEAFRARTRYFNTFSSSPLQAAAGLAVLDIIEDERLKENAAEVGSYLKAQLSDRLGGPVGAVLGHGLFIGVELLSSDGSPDPVFASRVVNRLKDRGFLANNAGFRGATLKLRPPLPFSRAHADAFLEAFDDSLAQGDGAR
ncbi:MAG: aspartate aminotransferase family protein [Alphaproteobacteria bacterium]|nr:aspartate aminotransferase family protein [Alphaproteobacteria bacterium]